MLDTRDGTGRDGITAPLAAGQAVDVQITGRGGVPSSGVTAVVLNATVTEPSVGGYITVWPAGRERPTVSNVNFTRNLTVANLVTVSIGAGGKLSLFNFAGSSHVVWDVAGFYSTTSGPAGSRFHPTGPSRVFDTRDGTGGARPKFGTGETYTYRLAGSAGLPASGVTAVVLNVTATDTTSGGYVTVYPSDVDRPLASNVNFGPRSTTPNLVTVRVPASGEVSFFNFLGSVNLVVDVVGYYDNVKTTESGRFVPYIPFRSFDTREDSPFAGDGRLGASDTLYIGANETSVSAVVVNITVTQPSSAGYITAYPYPGSPPLASNVNFVGGQTVANHAMVPTGPQLGFYNSNGDTHLIVDIFGIFT